MTLLRLKFFPFLLVGLSVLLAPGIAYADGMGVAMMWVGMIGIVGLVALTFAIAFGEAWVLRRWVPLSHKDSNWFCIGANAHSTMVGVPITALLNMWIKDSAFSFDLYPYFYTYPYILLGSIALFFFTTVLTEWAFAFRERRAETLKYISGRRLAKAIVLMNLASYAVLAPIVYYWNRPTLSALEEVALDSAWTANPKEKVIYIHASSGHLISSNLDGSESETLVDERVKGFLLSADLSLCLHYNREGTLKRRELNTGHTEIVTEEFYTDQGSWMRQHLTNLMALSPSGRRVAYCAKTETNHIAQLKVHDLAEAASTTVAVTTEIYGMDYAVAWSGQEDVLYITKNRNRWMNGKPEPYMTIQEVVRQATGECLVRNVSAEEMLPLAKVYGFCGRVYQQGYVSCIDYSADDCGERGIAGSAFLESQMVVVEGGEEQFRFAIDPGVLPLSRRSFSNLAFLPDCNECLFALDHTLHLLDINQRKVGKVADARDYILLNDRFTKARGFGKPYSMEDPLWMQVVGDPFGVWK